MCSVPYQTVTKRNFAVCDNVNSVLNITFEIHFFLFWVYSINRYHKANSWFETILSPCHIKEKGN